MKKGILITVITILVGIMLGTIIFVVYTNISNSKKEQPILMQKEEATSLVNKKYSKSKYKVSFQSSENFEYIYTAEPIETNDYVIIIKVDKMTKIITEEKIYPEEVKTN